MKLILDEHINPEVGRQLRRRGYDVISVNEAGLRGIGDESLLAFASGEGRVLVTYNIGDFQLLLREWRQPDGATPASCSSARKPPRRGASRPWEEH